MRVIRLGMALLLLLNLTGCWSKVELDELTFIYGMFIDKGEERGTVEVSIRLTAAEPADVRNPRRERCGRRKGVFDDHQDSRHYTGSSDPDSEGPVPQAGDLPYQDSCRG